MLTVRMPDTRGVLQVQADRRGDAEIAEAALEVLVQEGVEHGVEAAVGVAQGDAEVPGDGLQERVGDVHQGLNDDEDVDGGPTNDEDGDHHQHHAGDAPEVAVLLLGARQQADALQAKDHQPVAHRDDEDGHDESEDEDTDLQQVVPVPVWVGKLQGAVYDFWSFGRS